MKRLIALTLALMLAFSAAACGNRADVSHNPGVTFYDFNDHTELFDGFYELPVEPVQGT